MANRVSAWISLGGRLSVLLYPDLVALIAAEALSLEWDGAPFEVGDRVDGEPLKLHAHEVAGGQFDDLEAWLVAHGLPFERWCGGYGAEWTAEIVIFTGTGDLISYTADENEQIFIDRETVERLGTVDALRAHFDAADFVVPPLSIVDYDQRSIAP